MIVRLGIYLICVMFSFGVYFIEMQHFLNLRGVIMKSLTEKEEREHYEKIMGWIGCMVHVTKWGRTLSRGLN